MINLFRRKKIKKESNVATTPEDSVGSENFTKSKVFFFIWNILSITLYSAYTLFVIYEMAEKTFLSKIIMYLLYAYGIAFILLILINIGNRRKLKSNLKNYKSATKFLKYAMQILNFILSITTALSALFSGAGIDFKSVLFAILSFIVTIVLILFEIAGIIVRKNISVIKHNFLEIREKPVKRKKQETESDITNEN